MSKYLNPLNDRILIKPIEEGESLYGNIIIPDMGKEKPEIGKVIAVGPGRLTEFGSFIPIPVKVGDTVLVPKIGTLRVDFKGEEYYITPAREILATITDTEDGE